MDEQSIIASIGGIANGLNDRIGRAVSSVGKLRLTSESISENSARISASAQQLSESITTISGRAEETTNAASEAAMLADAASKTVQGLIDAANHINEMAGIVGHLARQTRLLSLNATIEAARAGEHGTTFAVVAGEVKRLAEQAKTSADAITQNSLLVSAEITNAVASVEGVAKAVTTIRKSNADITAEIVQQRQAASEIAASVAGTVQHLDDVVSELGHIETGAKKNQDAAAHILKMTM
jgi:methyl-accepting chemotaxis protein